MQPIPQFQIKSHRGAANSAVPDKVTQGGLNRVAALNKDTLGGGIEHHPPFATSTTLQKVFEVPGRQHGLFLLSPGAASKSSEFI